MKSQLASVNKLFTKTFYQNLQYSELMNIEVGLEEWPSLYGKIGVLKIPGVKYKKNIKYLDMECPENVCSWKAWEQNSLNEQV